MLKRREVTVVFNIGDKIVYGSEGVFFVSEYTTSPLDKADERVFYVLRPAHGSENNIIVTPSEGGMTSMRRVMSREEAISLIDRMHEIDEVEVVNERGRRDAYRAVMGGGRGEDFVSIIKTVRRRRAEFLAQTRRLSETDTDFEGRAKNCLLGELAVALDIPHAEVERFIEERIG